MAGAVNLAFFRVSIGNVAVSSGTARVKQAFQRAGIAPKLHNGLLHSFNNSLAVRCFDQVKNRLLPIPKRRAGPDLGHDALAKKGSFSLGTNSEEWR